MATMSKGMHGVGKGDRLRGDEELLEGKGHDAPPGGKGKNSNGRE
jgi:hypothetical protein